MEQKLLAPGVAAVVSVGNRGDKRRKRKVGWAVMLPGTVRNEQKVSMGCSVQEALEISKAALQPVQVRMCVKPRRALCMCVFCVFVLCLRPPPPSASFRGCFVGALQRGRYVSSGEIAAR